MAPAETAHAKINLALHVRRRRPDGYHELDTLFAFAVDGDTLRAEPADELTLAVEGPEAGALPAAGDNLVLRAARLLRERTGATGGARLTLTKRLPVASGIGGGSADAGAALRLLARLWGVGVPERLPAGIGADVPACLLSRTAWAEGLGYPLHPVADGALAGVPLLLVNPRAALSTARVFAGWDGVDRGPLGRGDPLAVALGGRNDLEPPAIAAVPAIGAVLAMLGEQRGVRLARMSGSGATCFALFDTAEHRDLASARLAAARPGDWHLASALL